MKKAITEDSGEHKQWYEDAKGQTLATLPEFLRHLSEDYGHDYGTICHAVSASAIAAASALNASPCGGITGFQAGCVMWSFIQHWMHLEGAMKLVEYDNMLYPQYAHKFAPTISKEIFASLQKQAREKLAKADGAHPNVLAHWQRIVDGEVPFGYEIER
jgi:hypothetical protein